MGARVQGRRQRVHRALTVSATAVAIGGLEVSTGSSAGASSRQALSVATTSGSGAVLVALGGGVLVLGIVGLVVFTYLRRKRKPNQCAEQRDALELAEKAVNYWEAARTHLEAVGRGRTAVGGEGDDDAHASLVANALEGLQSAMRVRDERHMELIRCMATGSPGMPIPSTPVPAQPFFTPETDGPTSSTGPTSA